MLGIRKFSFRIRSGSRRGYQTKSSFLNFWLSFCFTVYLYSQCANSYVCHRFTSTVPLYSKFKENNKWTSSSWRIWFSMICLKRKMFPNYSSHTHFSVFILFLFITLFISFLFRSQGVTKICRLSWLTNTALVYERKWGGGGLHGSQSMSTWSPYKLWRSNSIFNLFSERSPLELKDRPVCCSFAVFELDSPRLGRFQGSTVRY